jgi:hypothetical protein
VQRRGLAYAPTGAGDESDLACHEWVSMTP